jgi:hypothetical protein
MPLQAHGCKVISIGFFTDPDRSVIWRGPMLHRALQQFLADVYWGELDFLLCDLPPGTGDIAISLAQMLPNADMVVVTTPQQAAQKVALRAGKATEQTGMQVGRRDREHGDVHLPGLRLDPRPLRNRRRRGARRGARHRAARPHPDRPAAARGRRRRHPAGRLRPRRARRPRRSARSPTSWSPVVWRPGRGSRRSPRPRRRRTRRPGDGTARARPRSRRRRTPIRGRSPRPCRRRRWSRAAAGPSPPGDRTTGRGRP